MKITRTISSAHPNKCHMIAKGFFGNVKGEVLYGTNIEEEWYDVIVKGNRIGQATDFLHACDMLLNELGIVKTVCV